MYFDDQNQNPVNGPKEVPTAGAQPEQPVNDAGIPNPPHEPANDPAKSGEYHFNGANVPNPPHEPVNDPAKSGEYHFNGANVPNPPPHEPVNDPAKSGEYHFNGANIPNPPPHEPVNDPIHSGEYHFNGANVPGGNAYHPNYGPGPEQPPRQPDPSFYNQNGYDHASGYARSYQGSFAGEPVSPRKSRKRNKAPKPPKPPRQHRNGAGWGKVVALALVCSMLGGLVGAGGMYAVSSGGRLPKVSGASSAQVAVSDRVNGTTVSTKPVKAGEAMTSAQIYSAYGSAVVSVTVKTSQGEGAGTGFIIDADKGYLLTCYHVVDGAEAISVTLTDTTSYEATYVGGDEDQDVAVLKFTPDEGVKLNSVVLGDSSILTVGDSVSAIGNALGTLANTMTTGSVSALDRAITMSDGTAMRLLQTDCTINSGNSGGPLFNQYGEVIGIVNAKYSSGSGFGYSSGTATIEGIGFAIPINDVTEILDDLMTHGYVTGKPYLGITVATVSAVTAQQYSNMVVGAYVRSVSEGSCAEKAGIQVGDIITQVDGVDITTNAELIEAKNNHKAGEEMTLTLFRDSDYVTVVVTLDEEQPDEEEEQQEQQQQQQQPSGGTYNPFDGFGYGFGGFGGW